ncbi:glycosyltransferase [Candidatus Roizmanbacteria bacterium]|nr:glycosyltransferase [Candidatus Roizmanbacteria bacterium]
MISVIIVHYKVKKELFACIKSIYDSRPKAKFEIIVVDNDDKKIIHSELKKKFPKVKYVVNRNRGFGQGNNIGVKHAEGEYLFFLNPDTNIFSTTIDSLLLFFKKAKVGMVAPLLLGSNGGPYQQGSLELTPQRGWIVLSFLNKLFPKNIISQKYFINSWIKEETKEVDVIPGTALMIKKEIFEKVGGFDEKFFLYFEEFDLCKRVRALGYKLYIYPDAKVMHKWGASTKKRSDIDKIFRQSRFYYFKKHFGLPSALLTEFVLGINKYSVSLFLITALGVFLRFANLSQNLVFIGDQGWFYLSARDMLLNGNIPLLGIASSHPWLHQGALWTYLLALVFKIFGFNPLNGAYLAATIDALAILAIYYTGFKLFSKKIGILSAFLYATSPLVLINVYEPYHTSPIPLFTVLFILFLYKWINGNRFYFPLIIVVLAILYNLELATILLGFITGLIFICGLLKKKEWAIKILNFRILFFSLLAFLIIMLPMLIYDAAHFFPQTFGFLSWIGYRALVLFGYPPIHEFVTTSFTQMLFYSMQKYSQLIFPYSAIVALLIFVGSIVLVVRKMIGSKQAGVSLIIVLNTLLIAGFLAARTPSDAYLPMLFPGLILLIAVAWGELFINKITGFVAICLLLLIASFNSYFSVNFNKNALNKFENKISTAKYIIKQSLGKEYNLKGSGPGGEFTSFTMNYEYLTWYLGHGPSSKKEKLKFVISEDETGIHVKKIINL